MYGHQPKYGPRYSPPSGGDGGADVNAGRDLWLAVPWLSVPQPWNSGPPSFNDDPAGPAASGGDPPEGIPLTTEFHMHMPSVRTSLDRMLADTKLLVNMYDDLRLTVWTNKDNIFGQNALVPTNNAAGGNAASQVSGGGGSNQVEGHDKSPIQDAARGFALHMIPAEELALKQIADALEMVGMFIAGVDRAGQSYAQADRKARFPDPPRDPVT
jgi:hypothetical protein